MARKENVELDNRVLKALEDKALDINGLSNELDIPKHMARYRVVKLFRRGDIDRICLVTKTTRGSYKYGLTDIFRTKVNGMRVYYTDKDSIIDYLKGKLKWELNMDLDRGKKRALTHLFKRMFNDNGIVNELRNEYVNEDNW